MALRAEKARLWLFDGTKCILTEGTRDGLMARIREAWEAFQPLLDRDVAQPLADAYAKRCATRAIVAASTPKCWRSARRACPVSQRRQIACIACWSERCGEQESHRHSGD